MNKYLTFLLLFFGLIIGPWLHAQNLITTTYPGAGWVGGDDNDPSGTANNPTGVACAGGGFEEWINFDGMAGNNASQEGGSAIGARHNGTITYTFTATVPAGDYLLFYEQANPGLLECDGTMLNGNGRWRFNIGNGNVNGPIITGMSTATMEWSKASVSLTATAAFTSLTMTARRQGTVNPYMQIDNIILVEAPAGVCDGVDLGSPALNACYGTEDVCYPTNQDCAAVTPGDPYMNPAGCVTAGDPDPDVIIPIPDFDCAAAEAVTFDMVVPDLQVYYHYWGNCSAMSPVMPTALDAQNQGFIQQFFCASDTDGLPAFPGGLSNEKGLIDNLPSSTEETGCNGFVDETATDCICGGGSAGTDPEDEAVELIQLDFWVAIPDYQTQVGFTFLVTAGNPADAASIFVGPNTANMCEVAYFNYGGAGGEHNNNTQASGTYALDHTSLLKDACNSSWLRVRIYITDVKDKWGVEPQIDCGNGYGSLKDLPIAAAMNAGDNTQPAALTTMSVDGYSMTVNGQEFLYDDQGVPKKYACNPVPLAVDEGVCMLAPLPVELISFDAFLNDKQVTLKWQTASELNNEGFEIQKSTDGIAWDRLEFVAGKGSSNSLNTYKHIDKRPTQGLNYYRLKQVDFDGAAAFSQIVSVKLMKFKDTRLDLNLYPNPALVQEKLYLDLTNFANENVTINILDARGQLLVNKAVNSSEIVTLNLQDLNLGEGMYYLRCQSVLQTTTGKFLVVK